MERKMKSCFSRRIMLVILFALAITTVWASDDVSPYSGLSWSDVKVRDSRPNAGSGANSKGLDSYQIQKIERKENGKTVYYYRISNPNGEPVKISLSLVNPSYDIEFKGILNDLSIKRKWAKDVEDVRYAENPPNELFMNPGTSFLVRYGL